MKTSYVICSRNGWHWYVSAMKYGPERELIFKTDTYVENGKNVTYQTTYLGNYEKVYRTGGAGTLTEHKFYVGDIVYTQRSNGSSDTFVSWNWKAGGSASSNSDGSITSSVSANTTSGFSIVTWTGTGSAGTVGHGLSSVPNLILFKNRSRR